MTKWKVHEVIPEVEKEEKKSPAEMERSFGVRIPRFWASNQSNSLNLLKEAFSINCYGGNIHTLIVIISTTTFSKVVKINKSAS